MKLSSALVDVALELVSLKEKNAKQVIEAFLLYSIDWDFSVLLLWSFLQLIWNSGFLRTVALFCFQVETERIKLKSRGGNDQLEMLINKKNEVNKCHLWG